MYDMDQSPEWHHKDIFAHTLQVVDNAAKLTNKMEIRFAALVHDIAKPPTRRIDPKRGYTFHGHDAIGERMLHKVSKRLRLSSQLSNYLKKLTLLHLRPIALAKNGVTDSAVRRLMVSAGPEIDDLMTLCRADITTKNPKLVNRYLRNFNLVEDRMKVVLNKDSAKKFQSPVRGLEIMEIFNIKEGKKVGELKKSILNGNKDQYGQEANVYKRISADDIVLNEPFLKDIEKTWGPAPGKQQSDGSGLFILGEKFGNVFVGIQPAFGFEGDPMRLLFEKGFAPTHAFSSFYRFLRKDLRRLT